MYTQFFFSLFEDEKPSAEDIKDFKRIFRWAFEITSTSPRPELSEEHKKSIRLHVDRKKKERFFKQEYEKELQRQSKKKYNVDNLPQLCKTDAEDFYLRSLISQFNLIELKDIKPEQYEFKIAENVKQILQNVQRELSCDFLV